MEHPIILVADGDPKNLQILRESLEAAGFGVILAADGMQAWQKSREDTPDLILAEVNLPKLDGFQLLEKLKSDAVTSSIPLMFLTNRREIQDRVRSLRGGVKDYMIKPLHVKEVIGRIRMILRRMERMKDDEMEANRKLVGRLEEFGVVDLIESFGVERKTGILTLHNEHNKIGEIYFRDGAVINAALGNIKAEKAVYRMLPWRRGNFTMLFREINVADDISVSNLGLLLQGFKRMEERERLFKQLPSPETAFATTDEFRQILAKREITTDVAKFIALIDGKRDILQIIDESTYDDLKALERLVKLYRQGLIKAGHAVPAPVEDEVDITTSIAEPQVVHRLPANGDTTRTAPLAPVVQAKLESRAPNNGPPVAAPSLKQPARIPEKSPTLPPLMPDARLPEEGPIGRKPIDLPKRSMPPVVLEHFDLPVPEKKPQPPAEEITSIDFQFVSAKDAGIIDTPYNQVKPASGLGGNGPAPSPVERAPERAPIPLPPPEPAKPKHAPVKPAERMSIPLRAPEPVEPVYAAIKPAPAPADAITANLLKLIGAAQSPKPKFAILGRDGQQVENLLLAILGPESRLKKVESATFQHLEIGERRVGDAQFEIIGVSMEQQFTRLLATVARELVGYIVVVEAQRKDDVEYLNYLLGTLKTLYRLPMGIAVVKSKNEKNLSVDALRDLLGAEAMDYMRECDPSEVNSITEFWSGFCVDENLRRWTSPEKTGSS